MLGNDLFIFDLDDTLVMTEKIHHECWNAALNQSMTYEQFCSIFHTSVEGGIEFYLKDRYKELVTLKADLFCRILATNPEPFTLNEGCETFLRRLIVCRKPFVIVTNSQRRIVDMVLQRFPILALSLRVYCREDMTAPKPNSACFAQVLRDFPCQRPVIFEDSLTGIIAASGVNADVVFVNRSSYIHYDTIVTRYRPTKTVMNFIGLDEDMLVHQND